MFAFWGLTGLAAAGAVLLILSFARRAELARGSAVADDGPVRELEELERLKARGLLDDAGFDLARAEVARRALAAEPEAGLTEVTARARRWVPLGAAAAVLAAGGLYFGLGRPGMADQPMAGRVAQWAASPQTLDAPRAAAVMAEVVRRNPDDPQALALLGAARFEAGDPVGAASAFRRLLALHPEDAQAWARLGESLVRAAEGRVDGDAEAAFREALRLDPDQLGARYFLGEAALERGDAQGVREMWGPLIAALDPADPRRADLVARLPGGGA
ncbi:MAG TPA: c-type cytochrome biogenesis protein CcmI [Brevundimonas sp.]|jgi:cytochrome c-type biogenesis protein CcmH|uniref:c-type cytochrome biogenesis protein CcmI n=1 Tax=Brevundimonas sp. TaxID=1871086 RepID=UPI002DE79778|nr:c-type cytochrome biogenesis protein CcmI [Brevundimonas sp.]